jgi:hypothetical protein
MIDKNLIYNDILFDKIKNSSTILNIDTDNHYMFDKTIIMSKNLTIKNITYDQIEKFLKVDDTDQEIVKFDFIIFYKLLSYSENDITSFLKNLESKLKIGGYIMIINILLTSYYYYIYHPFSYTQSCILGKSVYLTIIDDMFRNIGYKIKNITRLYSIDILKYPVEYFCVIIQK